MNARQKAKKYKQELDILKGKALPYTIEKSQGKVKTIMVEDRFRAEDVYRLPPKVIANSMVRTLAHCEDLVRAVKLDNFYDRETDTVLIQAKLKVVMPE